MTFDDRRFINVISKRGNTRRFDAGEFIFSEGDKATFLPVVLSGRVKMVRYPEAGKEVIIGTFGEGEIFAIPPAFDGKHFPATAVAMEESQLAFLPRSDFLALMAESPEFSTMITARMCGLLRDRAETVQMLATQSAEHRVASVLLKLAGEDGNSLPYRVKHRRQDIAEMCGLTIESTIRSIRKLADRGLVKIVRGKILIESTEPLRDLIK